MERLDCRGTRVEAWKSEEGYYRNPRDGFLFPDLVIRVEMVEMVRSGSILSYFECTHQELLTSRNKGWEKQTRKDNAEIFIPETVDEREPDRGASVEGQSGRSIRFPSGDGKCIIGYYNLQ